MKCTTLLFPTPDEMWEFQRITKTSTLYISEPELILKGLFEESDVELACEAFKAKYIDSIIDN